MQRETREDVIAHFKAELEQMRRNGVERVRISTARDEGCCPSCRALQGVEFPIAAAPNPAETCTGQSYLPNWCRCVLVAVIKR